MVDDKKNGPPRKRTLDLDKLNEQVASQGATAKAFSTAMKKATDGLNKHMSPLHAVEERLREDVGKLSGVSKAIEMHMNPLGDVGARMKALRVAAGEGTALGRLSKQIEEQQLSLNSMRDFEVPKMDIPSIPPHPAHETNKRLERIEDRFEQMQGVAKEAAEIATSLQAAAAEFLLKFEDAANENGRAASRAIKIGVAAVIIAVAMPATQILYSEFRREPGNGPQVQALLETIRDELATTREAQADVTKRLDESIASANDETAVILRDIRTLLSRQIAPPAPQPQPQNPPN